MEYAEGVHTLPMHTDLLPSWTAAEQPCLSILCLFPSINIDARTRKGDLREVTPAA